MSPDTEATRSASVFNAIQDKLRSASVEFEVVEHQPTKSSKESAEARGTLLSEGAKALLVKGGESFFVLVIPADGRLDTDKAKTVLGVDDVRMASEDELFSITGLRKGSLPPMGSLFDLETVFDASWPYKEHAAFNAGSPDKSVVMEANDLLNVEDPRMADLVE